MPSWASPGVTYSAGLGRRQGVQDRLGFDLFGDAQAIRLSRPARDQMRVADWHGPEHRQPLPFGKFYP
jgi:hypothetical protein